MSSIDAVIAEARRPGGFTERKRFTLARTQAIQKLRQFALADPAAYVLELVQSAIANGASWIEIERDAGSVTVAYIGGGIPEAALGRLFDFLFASKDRADLGYLRELAIGINALMAYQPTKIVIMSGDGTRAGTTRMELLAGEDRLDVGRPDQALAGTFIRAEGLRRDRGADDGSRERTLIETRCLAAPVPILFNGEAVFGHSTRRIPGLLGFRRHMSFDEGDLYGAIGLRSEIGGRAEFSLLTRGVLIEQVEHPLIDGQPIGGVICFDGLRKTADHARVVRDDRFTEMWLRVRPYARALLGGEGHDGAIEAREFAGAPIGPVKQLRTWLREAGRVVVVAPGLHGRYAGEIRQIAAALGAKLLAVDAPHVPSLRILGGNGVEIHIPRPGSRDLAFYKQDPARPPPRPWLVQPVDVPAATVAQLGTPLFVAALAGALGETAELHMRVYTRAVAEHRTGDVVQLLSSGRELARFDLPSPYPGHVLVVDLPIVAPSQLEDATPGLANAARVLAEGCLRHAEPALAEAADRVLASLVDPKAPLGPLERHRALGALVRAAVPRLRRSVGADGSVRAAICFSLFEPGPPGVDLLALPLFTAASGRALSARELAAAMTASGGWLLAAEVGAATPGDPELDHVVRVDAAAEPLLRALVGDAAYLRVDGTCPKEHVPAAIDGRGRPWSAETITAALASGRTIVAHYGHATRSDGLPYAAGPHTAVPDELWLPPWSFLALADRGALLPGFDFHLGDPEAREHGDELAFVACAPVAGQDAAVDGQLGVPLAAPALPGVVVVDERLRPLHRFAEVGHDHGVVGLLRLRGEWSELRAGAVGAAIDAAISAVYEDLLARVPTMDPHGPAFARATAAMLAHAGRRVHLVADAHGQLRVTPPAALADRVLALPLFPGRRGLPLAAWQPIRRFVASNGDLAAALSELDLPGTPAGLREWLTATLAPDRIARPDAPEVADHAPAALLELDRDGRTQSVSDAGDRTPLDEVTLATTLEYWLHHLRPDGRTGPRGRPWDRRGHVWIELEVAERGEDFAVVTGDDDVWSVTLRRDHWLVRWACASGRREREAVAWLLLACYARLNETFDALTNHHEGQFQRAVADALTQGRLAIVTPRRG